MRIRKRPARAVEVVRAVPASENKPESVPSPVQANGNTTTARSERCDIGSRFYGGSVEHAAPVVSKERANGIDVLAERANDIETSVIHSKSQHDAVERQRVANGERQQRVANGERQQRVSNGERQQRVSNGSSSKQKGTSSSRSGAELLMKSLLVVFERAGTQGLTTREAVAKLGEYNLPGLQDGERPSVQVAKALRTPDFVHLEDGKYFIYPSTLHTVVAESSTQSESSQQQQATFQARQDAPRLNNNGGRQRRKRKTTSVVSDGSKDNTTSDVSDKTVVEGKADLKKRRRRPPSSQHELGIGPRQCKRYDGRGWQCSRETEEGFSFCEHHQALMNKRTLRLNLAKKRRKGSTDSATDMDVDQQSKAAGLAVEVGSPSQIPRDLRDLQQLVVVASHGIEDLIHNQRRRLVKARSLKSIK